MTIELSNLSFCYPKAAQPALEGNSATILPGMHLLLGENGAGKTTLLHVIAGLLNPTKGTCKIDGCPTRFRLPSINSHMFFTGVGIDFPAKTINEMTRIHAQFFPQFSSEQLKENLAAFGMTGGELLSHMSTGNAQKAKTAYALALNVDVLLLDEPANGLDIESKHVLQQLIARQTLPEQTVIVSTHNVADLEHLYDGVIDLHRGHIQYAMPVDDIVARLRFVISDSKPAEAIFSEMRIGRHHSIVLNDTGAYSDIDYQLLYLAARSPQSADKILSLL